MNREDLAAQLESGLSRLGESGDISVVIDETFLETAATLIRVLNEDDDHAINGRCYVILARFFLLRFRLSGGLDAADIAMAGRLVELIRARRDTFPRNVLSLVDDLCAVYLSIGFAMALDWASGLLQVLGGTPSCGSAYDRTMGNVSDLLLDRYETGGSASDLLAAEELTRLRALAARIPGELRAERTGDLSNLQWMLWTALNDITHLDQAIANLSVTIGGLRPDDPRYRKCYRDLSTMLQARFKERKQGADIERAVRILRVSLQQSAVDPEERAMLYWSLGAALLADYEVRHADGALDRAIEAIEAGLSVAPRHGKSRFALVNNYWVAAALRFSQEPCREHLDSLAQAADQVLRSDPAPIDSVEVFAELGSAYHQFFLAAGDIKDADRAAENLRHAIDRAGSRTSAADLADLLAELGELERSVFLRTHDVTHLKAAQEQFRQALALSPSDDSRRDERLQSFIGSCLLNQGAKEAADRPEFIALCRELLALPGTQTELAERRLALAEVLLARAEQSQDAEHLDEPVALLEKILRYAPENWHNAFFAASRLASAACLRYILDTTESNCTNMIEAADRLLAFGPPAAAGNDPTLLPIVDRLLTRLDRPGGGRYLDDVVRLAAAAWDRTSGTARTEAAFMMGVALFRRFSASGEPEHVEAALLYSRSAAMAASSPAERRAKYLSNLQEVLNAKLAASDQENTDDEAIEIGKLSVEANRDNPVALRPALALLGIAYIARYSRSKNKQDIAAAISRLRESLGTPVEEPLWETMTLARLGQALILSSKEMNSLTDLNAGIEALTQADRLGEDEAVDVDVAALLSVALSDRFSTFGQLPDSDASVASARRSYANVPPDSPAGTQRMAQMALTLLQRFDLTGRLPDIDEAVTLQRSVVAATAEQDPETRAEALYHLGISLSSRFRHTGQLADMEEAVDIERMAIRLTADDSPSYPVRAGGLSSLLRMRYTRSNRTADINESVRLAARAVYSTAEGSGDLAKRLSNLGVALVSRYDHTSDPRDLDEAVISYRRCIELAPDGHVDRGTYVFNLIGALILRFRLHRHKEDIDSAIDLGREAVATIPSGAWLRQAVLSALSECLRERAEYQVINVSEDLDEAVRCAEAAVRGSEDNLAVNEGATINLARALHAKFQATREGGWLTKAIESWRRVAAATSVNVRYRLWAARAAAESAMQAGWTDIALGNFTMAVQLLPELAWFGWDPITRREQLEDQAGIAADAAACAIRTGDFQLAVELLELGRSVMWKQVLDNRSDLSDLAGAAPQLAAELDDVRRQLDSWGSRVNADLAAGPDAMDLNALRPPWLPEEYEARMRLARKWDELVAMAREVKDDFLAATPFERLREAAVAGPVVIVNTSRYGCDALIIHQDPVNPVIRVELPGLSYDEITGRTADFQELLGRVEQSGRPFLDRERDRHAVLDILQWLWVRVAEPILQALPGRRPAGPPFRLWWCPTGPLAMLPLHAAGLYPRLLPTPGASVDLLASVMSRVISSYTPTLSALIKARAATASPEPNLLIVGMPTTPWPTGPGTGAAVPPPGLDLPWVMQEVATLRRHLPEATLLLSPTRTELDNGEEPAEALLPTRARVMAALEQSSWVHLACHGRQDLADPLESAVLVVDGRITLKDLSRLSHRNRDFAFLAACQTATGHSKIADEAMHLAAGVQMMGCRHVIATSWSISDQASPELADALYSRLRTATGLESRDTAVALHEAVNRLRGRHPTDPLRWAPYVHLGP